MIETMEKLGHARFAMAGHDRGGRVAYRLALDHPGRVERMATLDIVPTYDMWHDMDRNMAMKVWHWPFLAQPEPLPEMLISKSPVEYLEWKMASWTKAKNLSAFDPRALDHYRAAFSDPLRIHAHCEDYRAGRYADLANDEADRAVGKTITCPLLALWGGVGIANETGRPLKIWQQWAPGATGRPIDSGHFLTEESPDATAGELLKFFTAQ
jgi:haloacetate dehalogenase